MRHSRFTFEMMVWKLSKQTISDSALIHYLNNPSLRVSAEGVENVGSSLTLRRRNRPSE